VSGTNYKLQIVSGTNYKFSFEESNIKVIIFEALACHGSYKEAKIINPSHYPFTFE
jgi:hypothetical protein